MGMKRDVYDWTPQEQLDYLLVDPCYDREKLEQLTYDELLSLTLERRECEVEYWRDRCEE